MDYDPGQGHCGGALILALHGVWQCPKCCSEQMLGQTSILGIFKFIMRTNMWLCYAQPRTQLWAWDGAGWCSIPVR